MKPYSDQDPKGEQIRSMFDNIAPRYDFLNHLLSLGIDRGWRKRVVGMVRRQAEAMAADSRETGTNGGAMVSVGAGTGTDTAGAAGEAAASSRSADGSDTAIRILDLATGTGDLAIMMARRIGNARITGGDLSQGMLDVAKQKVERAGLSGRIDLTVAEAERLPFADGEFDAATVAFGVRNFHDIPQGIGEILRVLKPGGMLYVLEFSTPRNKIFGALYRFYFHRVLPVVGGWISGDRKAYTYLPVSVDEFPQGEAFTALMQRRGYLIPRRPVLLMTGVAQIYAGQKPETGKTV